MKFRKFRGKDSYFCAMIYFFDELPSTIDEARDARYKHGDVVVADHQTAGRGQRGTRWSSVAGRNLMFSVVLDTSFLRAERQFELLQAVAVALVDTLAEWGIEARVKWPNDIYVADRKITGVLIDHSIVGAAHSPATTSTTPGPMLSRSGVGVGINVNQLEFDPWLPNPTSMALETGREIDRHKVLERFLAHLMTRFEELRATTSAPAIAYHALMYRLGTPARYALPDGTEFTGTIRGVGIGGELLLDTPDGRQKSFLFKEVSFVI
jgi:BirA family biotin operon repressor/biotin-[acetyl-CoA-carboxylase] ligase